MKRGFKRSVFRFYVKAQIWLYTPSNKFNSPSGKITYILLVAVVASLTFKFKSEIIRRTPSNTFEKFQYREKMSKEDLDKICGQSYSCRHLDPKYEQFRD